MKGKIICGMRSRGGYGWWFRIFGIGLSFTNHRNFPEVFSERNGHWKRIHIGHWCFRFLPRIPANLRGAL